jgi:uroporphyrinogen-III decarboxylase
MNAGERLQNAIKGRPTDHPAVAPAYLSLYLDELTRRLYRKAYERKLEGQAPAARGQAVSIDHAEDSLFRAEAILRAYEILPEQPDGYPPLGDWIHTQPTETHEWAERGEMCFADGRWHYADRQSGEIMDLDEPGRLSLPTTIRYSYRSSHGQPAGADLWDASAGLDSRDAVDELLPIRTAADLSRQGAFDVTRILAKRVGDRVPMSCIAPSPFWSTYGLLGFQGMMVMMREKPDLFTYLMERRAQQRLEVLAGQAAAGVRYVWVEECLSSADLISPRDYERFAFATAGPYLAAAKQLGLTVIFYYCGDVVPRLPWLKRLGMDALAVEESKKGFTVDIEEVIAGVDGACCVFGNVDAIQVIFEGTRETIEAEAHRQIDLGRRAKGFVLCQGSPFTLDTPPSKVAWFVQCARNIESFARSHS